MKKIDFFILTRTYIISMSSYEINDILYNQALKSNMYKKYGCVIVYRNKIISYGYNHYKSKLYIGDNCLLRA